MQVHTIDFESANLPTAVLDVLPNPVLIKDSETRYVWINAAFERLFQVTKEQVIGHFDKDLFTERQVAQCNGGDLRVLNTGEVDEAYETLIDPEKGERETITRKTRLDVNGTSYLVGIMHDVTDISSVNRQLEESAQVLELQAAELRHLASSDPLTSCLNRRAMLETAPAQFAASGNEGGLLLLDIDRFKGVNDTFGHAGGDAALVHFADVVRANIRPGDSLARLGGEEFVAILPGASLGDLEAVAERIRASVEASAVEFEEDVIQLTVSAGGVHRSQVDAEQLDHWIADADECLYQAKAAGRNRTLITSS